MANIVETSVFESGVYQLETDDPVLGGPPAFDAGLPVTGHANAQAQQLANRTKWLYDNKANSADIANAVDPTKGAEMVGFKQQGEGTSTRTVSSKLQDILSIRDFSAVGDGVTNDTLVLQSAILNAENRALGGRHVILDLAGLEIKFNGAINLPSNITIKNGTLVNGTLTMSEKENITIDSVIFRDTNLNSLQVLSCNNIKIISCSAYNIGLSGTLDPTYQGFFVYTSASKNIVVSDSIEITGVRGQAAIGFFSSRECSAINNTYIHNVYYRGIMTYGEVADGVNEPLRHIITGNTITKTGVPNPSSSAVGENGVYVISSGPLGSSILDHIVQDNTCSYLSENGLEGHGIFKNNHILVTGFGNKTSPSKEGIYCTANSICSGNYIHSSNGSGIKISPRASNVFVVNNTIENPGLHGIECNNFEGFSSRLQSFQILENHVVMGKASQLTAYSYYIKDTSTGVTTFDASCKFLNNTSNCSENRVDVKVGLNKVTSDTVPSAGVWQRGDVIRNKWPSAGAASAWVCTAAGCFDIAVTLTGDYSNGGYTLTNVMGTGLSLLRVGDPLSIPGVGSSSDNNTIRRFVITSVVGSTITVDRPMFGAGGNTNISIATPTFSALSTL